MTRAIKFEYVLKCDTCGRIVRQVYSLESLEICQECDLLEYDVCEHADVTDGIMLMVVRRQYTGLHDKTRVEIYEGDIVKVSDPSKNHQIQEIVFKDGAFCGYSVKKQCNHTFLDILTRAHDVEIVGNVHENPELVEE